MSRSKCGRICYRYGEAIRRTRNKIYNLNYKDKLIYCGEVVLWMFIIILCVLFIYYLSFSLTYGIIYLVHTDYNFTTGCPIKNPNCTDFILCYENNMTVCYIIGMFITLGIMMIIFIGYIIQDCYKIINRPNYIEASGFITDEMNQFGNCVASSRP